MRSRKRGRGGRRGVGRGRNRVARWLYEYGLRMWEMSVWKGSCILVGKE